MNLIEKLEDEIWKQTRNGRDTVYIDVEDLKKLGCETDENKTGRVYVDVNYLRAEMKRYEFRDRIKVEPKQQTYREFMREIRNKERGRDDE